MQHPAAARASFFLQIGLRSFAGGNPAAALTRLQVPSWHSAGALHADALGPESYDCWQYLVCRMQERCDSDMSKHSSLM